MPVMLFSSWVTLEGLLCCREQKAFSCLLTGTLVVLLRVRKLLSRGKREQSGCSISVVGIQKGTRSPHGGLRFVVGMKLQFLAAVRQDPQTKPKQTIRYDGGMSAE